MCSELLFFGQQERILEDTEFIHAVLGETDAGYEGWGCGRKGW